MENMGGLSIESEFHRIMRKLHACNTIKYAAYRTASKLRVLEKSLGFHNIHVKIIKAIFEHHQIFSTDNFSELQQAELESILHDIHFAANKGAQVKEEELVQLLAMFIMEVYDRTHTGSVNILSIKTFLISLSVSPLQHKYQYWFSELADHNLCLHKRSLQALLESFIALMEFISEGNTFSRNLINATLLSCFTQDYVLGINEVEFMSWVLKEPQLLVWLSTLYRMTVAEKVVHGTHCSVCRTSPIVGLRYHCLKCICYDLCQTCFFTARANKRHKSSHMIREYCTEISSYEAAVEFLKGLLNRICRSPTKLQYLPAQAPQSSVSAKINTVSNDSSENIDKNGGDEFIPEERNPSTKRRSVNKYQAVISRIENELRLLKNVIEKDSSGNLINQHTYYLQEQINQLHLLQKDAHASGVCVVSTPMAGHGAHNDFELSSIVVHSEATWQEATPSGFSTWLQNMDSEKTYNQQLQADLDLILDKLHSMLETNFSDS